MLLIAFLTQGLLANDFIPVMNFLELSQLFVKVDNLLKLFSALHRHGLRFSVGFEHLDPVLNLLDLIEENLPLQRGLLPPLGLLVRCLGLDLLEVRALSRGRGPLGGALVPQLGRAAQALGRRDETFRLGRGGSQLLVLKYSCVKTKGN